MLLRITWIYNMEEGRLGNCTSNPNLQIKYIYVCKQMPDRLTPQSEQWLSLGAGVRGVPHSSWFIYVNVFFIININYMNRFYNTTKKSLKRH